MKHFIIVSIIIMFASKVMAHSSHYEGLKKIEMDTDRDNFMSANEAKKYGLIDSVLSARK